MRGALETIQEESRLSILTGTCLENTPMAIYAKLLEIPEDALEMHLSLTLEYYEKYKKDVHHYACLAARQEALQEESEDGRAFFIDLATCFQDDLNKINCLYTAANISMHLFLDNPERQDEASFIDILNQFKEVMTWHAAVNDKNKFAHILFYLIVIDAFLKKFPTLLEANLAQEFRKSFNTIKMQTGMSDDSDEKKHELWEENQVYPEFDIQQLVRYGDNAWFKLKFDDMKAAYCKALQLEGVGEIKQQQIGELMNQICQPQYHNISVYFAVPIEKITKASIMPFLQKYDNVYYGK